MKDKIMFLIIGFLIGAITTTGGFLIYNKSLSNNNVAQPETMQMNGNGQIEPPSNGNMGEPPAKPDGEEQGEPPAKPDGEEQGEPPVKPDGDSNKEPPTKPETSNSNNAIN